MNPSYALALVLAAIFAAPVVLMLIGACPVEWMLATGSFILCAGCLSAAWEHEKLRKKPPA